MKEVLTQVMSLVLGSALLSFFGLNGNTKAHKLAVGMSKPKFRHLRTWIIAIFFVTIVSLSLFVIVSLQ